MSVTSDKQPALTRSNWRGNIYTTIPVRM